VSDDRDILSRTPTAPDRRQFASDNYSGVCPEAWAAMERANAGHVPSYGDDAWTQRATDRLRDVFETDCDIFFVFNGTAANSLALASCCQSYHSILCHELAHVETDECGAPEFFSNGTKVLLLPGEQGKIEPAAIERVVRKRTDLHFPKPRAVSLTNATEVGTVYTPDELKAIWAKTKSLGLRLHLDGARFANAVASLGCTPKEITWQAGIDVLCFGGTKNGMAVGEAVVFFNRELAREFEWRCKQAGQLASKMRYLGRTVARHARRRRVAAPGRTRECHGRAARRTPARPPRRHPPLSATSQRRLSPNCPPPRSPRSARRAGSSTPSSGRVAAASCAPWDTQPEDVEALAADLRAAIGS
jgi:threonine aldolase